MENTKLYVFICIYHPNENNTFQTYLFICLHVGIGGGVCLFDNSKLRRYVTKKQDTMPDRVD